MLSRSCTGDFNSAFWLCGGTHWFNPRALWPAGGRCAFALFLVTGVFALLCAGRSTVTMRQSQEAADQDEKVLHVFSCEGHALSLITQ